MSPSLFTAQRMHATYRTAPSAAVLEHDLRVLWSAEVSGVRASAGAAHEAEGLATSERGSVSILVLFMGLVIFALAAMVWNTGEVTVAKLEAQTAADTAAYSSAVWTSRAINIVAATNAIALRDASAIGVCTAILFEGTWILTWEMIYFFGTIVPQIATGVGAISAAALMVPWLAEMALWLSFVIETGWPVLPIIYIAQLGAHLHELVGYQAAWIAAIPGIVDEERRLLEDYYDCDITLYLGNGSKKIGPPLHRGTPLTSLIPIALRYLYDAFGTDSWFSDPRFRMIVTGYGRWGWIIGGALGALAAIPALGVTHHVLSSQPRYSPLEFGPNGLGFKDDPTTWADYTVVATARKRASNERSKQLPGRPLDLMAPGIFGTAEEHRPVAYAQAETFNAIDGLLPAIKVGGVQPLVALSAVYPWRVWTDWGWQWQPRLTFGTLLQPSGFAAQGVTLTNPSRKAAKH